MVSLRAPSNFLVQRLHNLDSKDFGLKGLSMNNDRRGKSVGRDGIGQGSAV